MKKYICFIIIIACLFSLYACGSSSKAPYLESQVYDVIYHQPQSLLLDAPTTLLMDWDFKSIRDPYVEVSSSDYNMPIYSIDTYEKFLHFKDIVGEDFVSETTPKVNEYTRTIEYFDYRGGTFDAYTLLVGWFTVETHHNLSCYNQELEHQTNSDHFNVLISLSGDCNCDSTQETHTLSGLVLVALDKQEINYFTSISCILKDCFSEN